jgi:hypothetical protein
MQRLTKTEAGRVWKSDRREVFWFLTRDNPGVEERELDALASRPAAAGRDPIAACAPTATRPSGRRAA